MLAKLTARSALIRLRTVNDLTTAEAAYALETLFRWNGVKVVPTGATTPVVINATLDLKANTDYTVVAMGTALSDTFMVDRADAATRDALEYMQLHGGARLAGEPVNVVFIGSCTNSRLGDLRAAAALLQGRRVAAGTRVLVVPGSEATRQAAEAEGLDRIFRDAGAEWREPGCSMCLGMNGDTAQPGDLVVSTSNRNFEGRQGRGVRTVLASPLTAAASAITGRVTDPREFLGKKA